MVVVVEFNSAQEVMAVVDGDRLSPDFDPAIERLARALRVEQGTGGDHEVIATTEEDPD